MVKLKAEEKKQAKAEEESQSKKEPVPEKIEKIKVIASIGDFDVILYPLVTEKSVNSIEAENKITFVVGKNSNKEQIKKVVEKAYGVKVAKVNIIRDRKGRKKAIIKLKPEFKAQELATKLGVL